MILWAGSGVERGKITSISALPSGQTTSTPIECGSGGSPIIGWQRMEKESGFGVRSLPLPSRKYIQNDSFSILKGGL